MPETAVTAVIPCFNHGRYVGKAVESILGQTYQDVRVVVVNDGSTDPHTLAVLGTLPGPRVTVVHQSNGHLSAARNAGIRSCQSRYIVTLDADDYFDASFLAKALPVLDVQPGVGVVTCGARMFGWQTGIAMSPGGGIREFLPRNCARASALFRRTCWEDAGGYDEAMKRGYEDWDFWIRVTARGWQVHALPEALLNYRCSRQSMVTGSDAIRPELVRELAVAHLPLYREHVADVLYEKERQIQSLERRLDRLRGSLPYRVGRCLTEPLSVLRNLVRRGLATL